MNYHFFLSNLNIIFILNQIQMKKSHTEKFLSFQPTLFTKQSSQNTLMLSNFNIIGKLGRGATSHVFKVKDKKVRDLQYAMKVIDKKTSKYSAIKKSLETQIKIHEQLIHVNVVRMVGHIEDNDNHYLLTQYCNEGELSRFLGSDLHTAKFLSYQLAMGLQYLHTKGIMHCDLKPSNILLKQRVLVLRFLKQVRRSVISDFPAFTRTCGTPLFMAPELIKKLPYGLQVDCWSFGICLYMLINGKHPFSAKTQLQLSQQIVKCDFQYPSKIDSEAQDLLKKILVVNPSKRLTIQQILRHPFFSNELKQLNKQYSKLIKDFKINENHKDNSFQDASTVAEISNPEQFSLKKLGLEENIKSQKQRCQRIVTKGLKPQAYQTSKVTAKILQDLSVEVQLQGTRIQISHDGDYIKIYRKNEIQIFFFEEMPKQYQKLYCYARNIVEILRSNTILKEIHNSDGKFWLMLNQIDFYGCIKDTCFHHNLLDYQIEISKNGMNLQKIHPIDYIRHNNDKLAQEIKIYLKNQKQFLKQL